MAGCIRVCVVAYSVAISVTGLSTCFGSFLEFVYAARYPSLVWSSKRAALTFESLLPLPPAPLLICSRNCDSGHKYECELLWELPNPQSSLAAAAKMSLVTAYCEGAEVEITSDGRSLPLYFDPEESHSEETTPHDSSIPKNYTYYVEALRDKMFTVKCTMTREFDMKSGNAVLVKTKPDGKGGWYKYVGKDEWIRNGKLFCQTMSYFPEYDPKTKKWRKAYFSFGHLDLSKRPKRSLTD